MAVLGGVVEVEAEVKTVVGGQGYIVRSLVDVFLSVDIAPAIVGDHVAKSLAVYREHRQLSILCGHCHLIARVDGPGGIHLCLLAQLEAPGQVQLVAVVELVVVPAVVELVEPSLVPRQRVGAAEVHALRMVFGVNFQAVVTAAAVDYLCVPGGRGRLKSVPAVVLQQVERRFVVALYRGRPPLAELGIEAGGPLVSVHGLQPFRCRHPVVCGHLEERVADLVYILCHYRVGSFRRYRIADLVFYGQSWVCACKGLATDAEK